MTKSIEIKGIKKDEFPEFYASLMKIMSSYSINKIRVLILPNWMLAAGAIWLFGDYLLMNKKIIEIMDEEEIEAVIAHELSHLFNRDSITMLTITLLFFAPSFFSYLIIHNSSEVSTSQAMFFLISLLVFLYGLKIRNWVSTRIEIRSDREAILRTRNPYALQKALIKLYSESLIRTNRPNVFNKITESFEDIFYYFTGFTHPYFEKRIENLELLKKVLDNESGQIDT